MDVEGIDVSIVFRTRAAHVVAVDGLDAELTAAVCRAFNNWLADFCSTNRARLKPAALLPVHDVKLAAAEARRSVKELGAVALVLPNQQVNGRPWYDRYYDPLWAEAERLHVPVAFHGIQMAYQEHLGRRYLDNFAMAHAVGHPVEMMVYRPFNPLVITPETGFPVAGLMIGSVQVILMFGLTYVSVTLTVSRAFATL